MATRKRTVATLAGIAIPVLLVVQFGSYRLMAPRRTTWTLDAFLEGETQLAFACVSQPTGDALSPSERTALRGHLLRRFPNVYFGEDAIPDNAKEEHVNKGTGERALVGLKG